MAIVLHTADEKFNTYIFVKENLTISQETVAEERAGAAGREAALVATSRHDLTIGTVQ